jgi:type III restriction enzyme
VYRLTPFEAYRQRLVKQIEVASVVEEDDVGQAFMRVERIDPKKRSLTARVPIHQLMRDRTVKERTVTVRPGDSLQVVARRPEYAGFDVEEINAGRGFVRFSNGIEVGVGEARGANRGAIFEAQIRYTVEEHLRKAVRLRPAGVKVLSLFFIDRVAIYASDEGFIRKLFLKSFNEI